MNTPNFHSIKDALKGKMLNTVLWYCFFVAALLFVLNGCKDKDEEIEAEEQPVIPTEATVVATQTFQGPYSARITINIQANKRIINGGLLLADHPTVTDTDKRYQAPSLDANGSGEVLLEDLVPGKAYHARPFATIDKEIFYGQVISLTLTSPTVTSVSPIHTGRNGRIIIAGTDFPTPQIGNMKVLLDGIELPIDAWSSKPESLVVRIPSNFPLGTAKNFSIVIKNEYVIDIDTDINIGHFALLNSDGIPHDDYGLSEGFYLNNKVYAFAGGSEIKIYDVANDQWSSKFVVSDGGTRTFDLRDWNSFLVKDRYFFLVGSSQLKELNFSTFSESMKTKSPEGTYLLGPGVGFSIGDKGFAGMGYYYRYDEITERTTFVPRAKIYAYDPATDTWTLESEFLIPIALSWSPVFTIGDEAFLCGGFIKDQNETVSTYASVWSYNVRTKGWTKYADYPGKVTSKNVGATYKGKGYVISGTDIWEFDPYLNAWSKFKQDVLTIPVTGVITSNDGIYIIAADQKATNKRFYLFMPE